MERDENELCEMGEREITMLGEIAGTALYADLISVGDKEIH